jgi:histidine triad (HIT) family protein
MIDSDLRSIFVVHKAVEGRTHLENVQPEFIGLEWEVGAGGNSLNPSQQPLLERGGLDQNKKQNGKQNGGNGQASFPHLCYSIEMDYRCEMQSCLFCRIIRGEAPSQVVYQDDLTVVFKDIRPQAPVHLLVCPRKHIPTLNDVQEEDTALLAHMFQIAKDMAMQFGVHETGYRTVFNVNEGAGQTIYHLHLHVIGGRRLSWPP